MGTTLNQAHPHVGTDIIFYSKFIPENVWNVPLLPVGDYIVQPGDAVIEPTKRERERERKAK